MRRLKNIAAWLLMLLIVSLGLAACQATGGTFCDVSKPIRLSPAEIASMSDQSIAQVLAHNEKGEKLCGWRP
jgi:hypothetical protein